MSEDSSLCFTKMAYFKEVLEVPLIEKTSLRKPFLPAFSKILMVSFSYSPWKSWKLWWFGCGISSWKSPWMIPCFTNGSCCTAPIAIDLHITWRSTRLPRDISPGWVLLWFASEGICSPVGCSLQRKAKPSESTIQIENHEYSCDSVTATLQASWLCVKPATQRNLP